jgi:hypothetical protein
MEKDVSTVHLSSLSLWPNGSIGTQPYNGSEAGMHVLLSRRWAVRLNHWRGLILLRSQQQSLLKFTMRRHGLGYMSVWMSRYHSSPCWSTRKTSYHPVIWLHLQEAIRLTGRIWSNVQRDGMAGWEAYDTALSIPSQSSQFWAVQALVVGR